VTGWPPPHSDQVVDRRRVGFARTSMSCSLCAGSASVFEILGARSDEEKCSLCLEKSRFRLDIGGTGSESRVFENNLLRVSVAGVLYFGESGGDILWYFLLWQGQVDEKSRARFRAEILSACLLACLPACLLACFLSLLLFGHRLYSQSRYLDGSKKKDKGIVAEYILCVQSLAIHMVTYMQGTCVYCW
jgi:hypothetical protein